VGRDMSGPWAAEIGGGGNNLHIFAIEKKAQRKRRMFNLKYNTKSYMF
jgi:hypothetical protein